MENNAIIHGRLKDLLDILDARAFVDIFVDEGAGKQALLRSARVYELLANTDFMRTYGRKYYVVGLTVDLSTSILISKEVDE